MLAVSQPHWVCHRAWRVCFHGLHFSGSRLLCQNCLRWAMGCMHFPGLSHSCSGSQVLPKGADSIGPAFCALPRSKHGEGNGTPLQYSCLENPMDRGAWKAAVHGVTEGRTRLSDFTFTFHFHALEKEMATHSSVLAWKIPGTGEPGGLLSVGSHRVRHD